jgi:hypothetical protein
MSETRPLGDLDDAADLLAFQQQPPATPRAADMGRLPSTMPATVR